MQKHDPKIVGLVGRRTRAPSEKGDFHISSPGSSFGICGPAMAQYDFVIELENGEAYKIGLVTSSPPDIVWFQGHFNRARHAYHRVH